MVKVKICGITTYEDALFATEQGADMLGFNFYKQSPRYISPDDAFLICTRLRQEFGQDTPALVGVFVNEVVGIISAITIKVGLDAAQLHGDESENMLRELRGIAFKAIQPPNMAIAVDDLAYYAPTFPSNTRLPSLLVDAYHPLLRGGTGAQASADIVNHLQEAVPRLMLAGGLTPENVQDFVTRFNLWGVDVASGVEDGVAGRKSPHKVSAFIRLAKMI
jgi:phosphoribosylanthranilate isomerase